MKKRGVLAAACLAILADSAFAQTRGTTPQQPVTLQDAIAFAAEHYPSVRASLAQVRASAAGVDVARAAYLPRLDGLWQSSRGTVANVFGQVLPQSVIPAMSGPVLTPAPVGSVWGSATGALLSWEPVDFGLRSAGITEAEASLERARATETLTRLDVQRAVADAFLAAVATSDAVGAAQADVERRGVLARAVHALVDNQLRAGAEASRADAERAAAETRLIQSKLAESLALISLSRLLGSDAIVTLNSAGLFDAVTAPPAQTQPTAHPLIRLRQASVDEARARRAVLSSSNLPRLYLQSSVSARGSGASADGTLNGSFSGLNLDRVNWAAGFQVVVPNLFEFAALRARKAAAEESARAQTAFYDESVLIVQSEQRAADATVEAARAVAANTPVQLAAAQQAELQARARYQAGLASIAEVADAQTLLAQAEVAYRLARVDVWRALVAQATARGSLDPLSTPPTH
jgi:outer membrane protein TolC